MHGMSLLGLSCGLLGIGLALLSIPTHTGTPPFARALRVDGVGFRELPKALDRGEAAQVFQVRIEQDGRVGLRLVAPPAWGGAGMLLGTWRFTGEPAADRQVLEQLSRALRLARHDPERGGRGAEELEEAGDPTRVVIDVAPEVPWVRSAWIVVAGTHHPLMLRRFAFLSQREGTWCDLDLPGEEPPVFSPRSSGKAHVLVVRLFRKGLDGPAAGAFTRMRTSTEAQEVWVDPDGFPWPLETELPASPPPEPSMRVTDFPPSPFVPPDLPSAWAALEQRFAEPRPSTLHFARLRMRHPIGPLVPTSDVVEVMLRLKRAGYATILVEHPGTPGTTPPGEPDLEPPGR